MTQHHQAPAIADISGTDDGIKLYSPDSEEFFPTWSHDRAPQDDAVRFHGAEGAQSPDELSEVDVNSQNGFSSSLPSFNTWLLLAGCCLTILLLALLIGYAVYKFRRRNEGSYNVEENRTFINQRSTSTLSPTSVLPPTLDTGTELAPLQNCMPVEVESPNKEWYV